MQSKALWVNCKVEATTGGVHEAALDGASLMKEDETHPDVIGQLHSAVLALLHQVDAVQVLQAERQVSEP